MKFPAKCVFSTVASFLFAFVISANAATTTPVGAVQLTIAAGNVPVAPAFVHPSTFQGQVLTTNLSGDQLTISVAANSFVSGALDEGVFSNFYAEVGTAGIYQGMYFDVISNTENELVLATWSGTPQPIEVGDNVIVRKHMTLGDFFEGAEPSLAAYADSVKIFYPGNVVYNVFWDGVQWTRNFVNNDSGLPIYPGQGFLSLLSSEVSFVVYGSVKSTPTQVPVISGEINFVGTMSPVDLTFSDLNTVSWMAPYADSFKLFVSDGSLSSTGTIFSDGVNMTDFSVNKDGEVLSGHSAVLLLPSGDINWPQPPAYNQ